MPTFDADARELVSTDDLYGSVEHLCAIGEKVAGSDEEGRACAYFVEKLRSYGYEPVVHEFDSYVSYPRSAALSRPVRPGTRRAAPPTRGRAG